MSSVYAGSAKKAQCFLALDAVMAFIHLLLCTGQNATETCILKPTAASTSKGFASTTTLARPSKA